MDELDARGVWGNINLSGVCGCCYRQFYGLDKESLEVDVDSRGDGDSTIMNKGGFVWVTTCCNNDSFFLDYVSLTEEIDGAAEVIADNWNTECERSEYLQKQLSDKKVELRDALGKIEELQALVNQICREKGK